jgi:subtilisin family serine protease
VASHLLINEQKTPVQQATTGVSMFFTSLFKEAKKVSKSIVLFAVLSLIAGPAFAKTTISKELKIPSMVEYTSWGVDNSKSTSNINLSRALAHFGQKKQVIVAVVDTGIDWQHPFLAHNIFVPVGRPSATNFGVDFSKNLRANFMPEDSHGHGTHVAGIIRSIYANVRILSLKYYNPSATGTENLNSTIKALEYAVDNNVDIINYSGGGPEPSAEEQRILKKAETKGILVVAAAGNERSNIDDKAKHGYFPASYGLSNIITVTAHDEFNEIVATSNWGASSVDIAAPGYRIRSSIPRARSAQMTGTSQATAFVTGVAALIKAEYPGMSPQTIRQIIKQSATKIPALKGKCSSDGRLDAAKAMDTAKTYYLASKKQEKTVAEAPGAMKTQRTPSEVAAMANPSGF